MKLQTAQSIVHHNEVETKRIEELNTLQTDNQDTIEALTKVPNDLRDWLEQAEAELSTYRENLIRLDEEIRVAKLKLQRPIEGLAKAEQIKKDIFAQLAKAQRRLAATLPELEEAKATVADYKQKELNRLANEIIDGALLMEELEALTADQRVTRMKQLRHDKLIASQKEKGKHYHRMIRKSVQEDPGEVVQVPCHGDKCQFCPPKEVAKT